MRRTGLTVAVEMFAVFEAWGRPDAIYGGLPYRVCRYDRYGGSIFVVRSGPGQAAAEGAVRLLTERFAVSEIWNFGVAGGLMPELSVGDICIVRDVVPWDDGAASPAAHYAGDAAKGALPLVHAAGSVLLLGDAAEAFAGAAAPYRIVRCASGDTVVSARGARVRLAAVTGADIVDMEAAGIAAAVGGTSCFMVKCISDGLNTAEEDITAAFRETARAAFRAFDNLLKKHVETTDNKR